MKTIILMMLISFNVFGMDCYYSRVMEDCNYDDLCIEQSIDNECILSMREDEPELTDTEIIRFCTKQM